MLLKIKVAILRKEKEKKWKMEAETS